MKLVAIWIALCLALCWSFILRAFGESPPVIPDEKEEEEESTTNPTTAATQNELAHFKQFKKEENFTTAQEFCGNFNGELVKIVQLNLTQNVSSSMTGWIGLGLSNSTFRWFNNEIASLILQCFVEPDVLLPRCAFFECMNKSSGVLPLPCVDRACTHAACSDISAVFFACVKVDPTSTDSTISSSIIATSSSTQHDRILVQQSDSSINVASSSTVLKATSPMTEAPSSITKSTSSIIQPTSSIAEPISSTAEPTSSATESISSITELASSKIGSILSITESKLSIAVLPSSETKSSSVIQERTSTITGSASSIAKLTSSITESISSIAASAKINSSVTESLSSIAHSKSSIVESISSMTEATSSVTETASSITDSISSMTKTKSSTVPKATETIRGAVNITKTMTSILIIDSSHAPSGVSSTTSPSTTSSSTTSPTTATEKASTMPQQIAKLKEDYQSTNDVNEIQSITTDIIQKAANDSNSSWGSYIPQLFEEKLMEYASASLKRHNGTYVAQTKEFDILLKNVSSVQYGGYLMFPNLTDEKTKEAGTENFTQPPDFIRMALNTLPQDSIFVGVLYHNLGKSSKDVYQSDRKLTQKLISKIISAEVRPKPKGNLSNITISLSHNSVDDLNEIKCTFINETRKATDLEKFSTHGCSVVSTDSSRTTCSCNHMTSFAVVTRIEEKANPASADHRMALSIITYVGITLSLIGETLTVCSYVLLIGLNTEQAHLHTNLAFSLGIAQIFFLIGMNIATNEVGCLVVTALIHYFYLATFCWMLVEGFHLYLMVVKVFNEHSYLKFYYLFSWLTPLVVVCLALIAAAAASSGIHGYVTKEDICWVSAENNFIWFFLGPVLLICLANLVLLFLVVREMTRMNKTKGAPSLQFRKSVKACLLLFPILGTTWVFCVLLIIKHTLAIEYIFTILNSVQGFMIFLFYVLRSSEIRGVLQQRKQRWATSLDLTNNVSTYQKTTLTNKSTPTSASSIKPILGNWVPTHPHTPIPRNSPSPHLSPNPRILAVSPRNSVGPQNSPPLHDTSSLLTTTSPLSTPDLFEFQRRPSPNQTAPLQTSDAETMA